MPRSRSREQRQGGGKELADRSIGEMSSELINLHDVKSATRAIAKAGCEIELRNRTRGIILSELTAKVKTESHHRTIATSLRSNLQSVYVAFTSSLLASVARKIPAPRL